MKKLFEGEYGTDLIPDIKKWILEATLTEDGGCRVYRPKVLVEIYDYDGNPLNNLKN